MLRTFLALDLDDVLIDTAVALSESLRQERELARARWVARSAMHVTLRFFGDTDDALVPMLSELTSKLGGDIANAIELRIGGLLAFPKEQHARVLVLRIEDDDALVTLAAQAERAARALGFPQQRHDVFHPHLTLARLREPPVDLRRLLASRSIATTTTTSGRATATAITLYKSELGTSGPTYTPLVRHSFGLPRPETNASD